MIVYKNKTIIDVGRQNTKIDEKDKFGNTIKELLFDGNFCDVIISKRDKFGNILKEISDYTYELEYDKFGKVTKTCFISIESAYTEMYERCQQGLEPDHIYVEHSN